MLKIVLTAVFSFFLVTSQAADDMPLPGDAPPVMARGAKGKAKPTPAPHTAAPHAAKKATARPRHVGRSSSKAKRVHAQPSKHLKSSKRSRITTRGHAALTHKAGHKKATPRQTTRQKVIHAPRGQHGKHAPVAVKKASRPTASHQASRRPVAASQLSRHTPAAKRHARPTKVKTKASTRRHR